MSTVKANIIVPYSGNTVTVDSPIIFNGEVDSSSGGFKFPDNTTQTSAATQPDSDKLADAWVACGEAGSYSATTIKSSHNISSVVQSGTCNIFVYFVTPMANNDYACAASSTRQSNYDDMNCEITVGPKTTTRVDFRTGATGWGHGCYGPGSLNIIVIGN